jgi:hypothetical protein
MELLLGKATQMNPKEEVGKTTQMNPKEEDMILWIIEAKRI